MTGQQKTKKLFTNSINHGGKAGDQHFTELNNGVTQLVQKHFLLLSPQVTGEAGMGEGHVLLDEWQWPGGLYNKSLLAQRYERMTDFATPKCAILA
jgi:hypothetical protein